MQPQDAAATRREQVPTDREVRDDKCLDALYEATEEGANEVSAHVLDGFFDTERGSYDWLEEARQEGLVSRGNKMTPRYNITTPGARRVEAARVLRDRGSERRALCQRRVLAWTDQHSRHDRDQRNALVFRSSPHAWTGSDYFDWDQDIVPAIKRLGAAGLVVVHLTSGGWQRVDLAITEEGQACAENFAGDPAAYLESRQPASSGSQSTQNFFGDVHGSQVTQAGRDVHATQNIGVDAASLLSLMQAIRDAAAEAPDEDTEPVLDIVRQVEDEARSDAPDVGWRRSLVGRVRTLGAKASTTAFSTAVGAATTKALEYLQT
jgi:hypothetical protein